MFGKNYLSPEIIITSLLLQTPYYKFSAHTYIAEVRLEPFGRIGIGVLELISTVLILILRRIWVSVLLILSIISDVIIMHLHYCKLA